MLSCTAVPILARGTTRLCGGHGRAIQVEAPLCVCLVIQKAILVHSFTGEGYPGIGGISIVPVVPSPRDDIGFIGSIG